MKIQKLLPLSVLGIILLQLTGCGSQPSGPVISRLPTAIPSLSSIQNPTNPTLPAIIPTPPTIKPKPTFSRIPVLMFHYIREVDQTKDPLGYNLSFKPDSFTILLDSLKKKGYQTMPIATLLDPTATLPQKPIILTFDDGYEDFYTTAWPILHKEGFTASIAIITNRLIAASTAVKQGATPDSQQYMDEAQIKDLLSQGVEILSHTVSHPDLSKDPAQATELSQSKTYLEKTFGVPVDILVYPSGKYNDNTIKLATSDGYKLAFTTKAGLANSALPPLEEPRIRIDNRYNLQNILSRL